MPNEKITDNEEPSSPTTILITANFFAVVVYLAAASTGWVEPELDDVPGASGGGAVMWFFFAVPVLLISFLGNFFCAVWTIIRRYRTERWNFSWRTWPTVLGLWGLAVAFDFSRHGM